MQRHSWLGGPTGVPAGRDDGRRVGAEYPPTFPPGGFSPAQPEAPLAAAQYFPQQQQQPYRAGVPAFPPYPGMSPVYRPPSRASMFNTSVDDDPPDPPMQSVVGSAGRRDESPRRHRSSKKETSTSAATRFVGSIDVQCRCATTVGDVVWCGEKQGPITIISKQGGERVHRVVEGHRNAVVWCIMEVNGNVWAGYSDSVIKIFNGTTFRLERELVRHNGGVYCLSRSANFAYSGSHDRSLVKWDLNSFEAVLQIGGHDDNVRSLAVDWDETMICTGSDDAMIRIWNTQTGHMTRALAGHTKGVHAMVLAHGCLWSGSEDSTVRVWNIQTGDCVKILEGSHRGLISSLAFVGDRIWSADTSGRICIWSIRSHKCVASHAHKHEGYITSLCLVSNAAPAAIVWATGSDSKISVWHSSIAAGPTQPSYPTASPHLHSTPLRLPPTPTEAPDGLTFAPPGSASARVATSAPPTSSPTGPPSVPPVLGAPNGIDATQLQAQLNALQHRIRQVEWSNTDLQRRLDDERNQTAAAQAHTAESEAALQVLSNEFATTKQMLEQIEAANGALDAQLSMRNRQIADLEGQIERSKQMEQNLTHKERQTVQITEKNSMLEIEVQRWKDASGSLRKELDGKLAMIADLQGELSIVSERHHEEVAALKTANNDSSSSISKEVEQLKAEMATARQTFAERVRFLEKEVDDRNNELFSRNNTIAKLSAKIEDDEKEKATLKSSLQSSTDTDTQAISKKNREIADLKQQLESAQSQNRALEERARTYGSQVDVLSDSREVNLPKHKDFITRTRAAMIRKIYEQHEPISKAAKLSSDVCLELQRAEPDSQRVLTNLRELAERITRLQESSKIVISNFFTEPEKMMLGTSKHHFPRDPEALTRRQPDSRAGQ